MKIFKSVEELIGGTPLLELCGYNKAAALRAKILGKLEKFNPAGSVKDRAALAMVSDAEKSGALKRGGVIIEPTSGNTGIGLACIAAVRGYRLILTMPETMSLERRGLLKAYGAELVLTAGADGMRGAVKKAEELAKEIENGVILGQFENPANPAAHFSSTGPEIWEDTEGKADYLVCGVGTGGTISGAGAYLKSKNPEIRIIAVEPSDSPVLTKGVSGGHKIQGIGAGFIPKTLNIKICDEVITVKNDDAFEAARAVALTDGILVGISSGAAIAAAKEVAMRAEAEGKIIVAVLPDTGERYLSVDLFV
jgi:cysteine synthase A